MIRNTLDYLLSNHCLPVQEYIDWLQRYIIVHSYIYYNNDDNVISDMKYDAKAKELAALKEAYPEKWKNSEYYEQFGDDYTGVTGFGIFENLSERQQNIIKYIVDDIYIGINGDPVYAVDKNTDERLYRVL